MSCNVTGNLIDIQAEVKPFATIRFAPAISSISRIGNSALVPNSASVKTDVNGDFTISLLPGVYTVSNTEGVFSSAQITVPDEATAILAQIIDAPAPVSVDAAQQAVLDARAERTLAQAARDKSQKWADEAEDVEVEPDQYSARHSAAKAAADREQTGLDRIATGEDREATELARVAAVEAADRVDLGALDAAILETQQNAEQTALDRVATGEDRVATAADRVQTGLDLTATETARDSSFANAKGGATLSEARALVADGDTFIVYAAGAETFDAYRRTSSTTETFLGSYPSSNYVFDRLETLSGLSGYGFALMDAAGRPALAVTETGAVKMPGTPIFNSLTEENKSLSDIVWAVLDENDRLALGINSAGNIVSKGTAVDLPEIKDTADELNGFLDATATIDCHGDSLTHGNTSGVTTPYPTALEAALPGRTVNNLGLTGRTSLQIATAFGAVPSILTVTDNTIPASGAVAVTITENGNFGTKSNVGTRNYSGALFGIPGTLSVGYNASNPNVPGTSTFTRATAGTAMLIPNRTPFIPDTGATEGNTVVIWAGRNDIISQKSEPLVYTNESILTNIQAMVDFLSPLRKRFIILTVTDSAAEYAGAADPLNVTAFENILALNYEIMRRWPRNAIDVRKILVNSYDSGEPADVTAFGRDQVPPSLQADGLHLNDAGYAIVAQAVADFITQKGW